MAKTISQLKEITDLVAEDIFPITAVRSTKATGKVKYGTIKQDILNAVHSHSNKSVIDKFSESTDGSVLYNGQSISGASSWNDISDKPFSSVSNADFIVGEDGVLTIKSDRLHSHSNKDVLDKFSEVEGAVLYNGVEITGFDFDALSAALTGGTLSGITIIPDTTNNTFNITVTGIPEIAIDLEGYWTIDGSRGGNPTKAQGEKGADGISPSANVTQTDTGATITITDASGETTATITNGANGSDGISPHIDTATGHWFIGEIDTGVSATASIDDTSIDGTNVTWSAYKINSALGDINTVLASVVGGGV